MSPVHLLWTQLGSQDQLQLAEALMGRGGVGACSASLIDKKSDIFQMVFFWKAAGPNII